MENGFVNGILDFFLDFLPLIVVAAGGLLSASNKRKKRRNTSADGEDGREASAPEGYYSFEEPADADLARDAADGNRNVREDISWKELFGTFVSADSDSDEADERPRPAVERTEPAADKPVQEPVPVREPVPVQTVMEEPSPLAACSDAVEGQSVTFRQDQPDTEHFPELVSGAADRTGLLSGIKSDAKRLVLYSEIMKPRFRNPF